MNKPPNHNHLYKSSKLEWTQPKYIFNITIRGIIMCQVYLYD